MSLVIAGVFDDQVDIKKNLLPAVINKKHADSGNTGIRNTKPVMSHIIFLDKRKFTYLLTPWSRAPLEKLTGYAASQEIPRIFGTRRFLTVLTSARHLSLS